MTLSWDLVQRSWGLRVAAQASLIVLMLVPAGALAQEKPAVDLPSSKQIVGIVPGNPQRLNSLPMSMAVSPDRRYVVTVNAGYGTFESKYDQSLAVMDTQTGKVTDFPDARTGLSSKETLYSGLAFSADGKHVYASMASLTDPAGDSKGNPGSVVAVYGFVDGKITSDRTISIPLQKLVNGRRTKLIGGADGAVAVPYPAAISVVPSQCDKKHPCENTPIPLILVADNLSDDVLLMDAQSGAVVTRFDLSESDAVPSTYPVALAVSKDGARAFVALWNASEVVELDLKNGTVGRKLALLKPADPVKPGTHPCAMEISPDGKTLYVALSNRDAVAAVDVSGSGVAGKFAVKGYFDTRLPGQSYFGAEPVALALSGDGSRLYAANMGSDAVAVIDTRKLTASAAKAGMVEPEAFLPTEWMPMSMAAAGNKLYVATAKGRGTGRNDASQRPASGASASIARLKFTYIASLLYGSLAAIDVDGVDLAKATAEVMESNRMKAVEEKIEFAAGGANADSSPSTPLGVSNDKSEAGPIRHVIYIIKENRTYDQVFGDLKQDGKRVGNGDASLAMYGESVTPNQHKLALQFGVLDNFYDSAEVSGDGHVWSNAAIGTDYLEKTWQQDYRNSERTYDYEGMVSEGYPLLQKIPDMVEPSSGYMWGNAEAHGKTHYNFGEYVSSTFCDAKKTVNPRLGPVLEGSKCARAAIKQGEQIPSEWGGGVSKWPWAIPLLVGNVATKPELVGHFAAESPDFNLRVPDQIRMNVFLRYFDGWVADRAAGKDTMPNYITLRLGNDHTAGTVMGGPTPKSLVADNDLAVGRMVEAISHSAYWDDTAIFILEDDAQNGADHVDAHRSLALVISKYAPRAADGGTFVDSRFYSTVSVVRTMETLIGLPPMNNNDALASLIGSMFTGPGNQKPFAADAVNRENGLIYRANGFKAAGAKESAKMNFTHADRVDARKLNVILWRDAMGDVAMPAQLMQRKKKKATKDEDD